MNHTAQKFLLERIRRVYEPPAKLPPAPAAVKAAQRVVAQFDRQMATLVKAQSCEFHADTTRAREVCYGDDYNTALKIVNALEHKYRHVPTTRPRSRCTR